MCNLYSITKNQDAIRRLFKTQRDSTGDLPPMPGVLALGKLGSPSQGATRLLRNDWISGLIRALLWRLEAAKARFGV
jgi:hypothetical protein